MHYKNYAPGGAALNAWPYTTHPATTLNPAITPIWGNKLRDDQMQQIKLTEAIHNVSSNEQMQLNYLHPSKQRTLVGNYCAAAKQTYNGNMHNKTYYTNLKEIHLFLISNLALNEPDVTFWRRLGGCKIFPESNAYLSKSRIATSLLIN